MTASAKNQSVQSMLPARRNFRNSAHWKSNTAMLRGLLNDYLKTVRCFDRAITSVTPGRRLELA